MRTTIDIPDDLLAQAREVAAGQNVTLDRLAEEGLALAIDRRRGTAGAPRRFEPVVFGVPGETTPDLSWPAMREAIYGDPDPE